MAGGGGVGMSAVETARRIAARELSSRAAVAAPPRRSRRCGTPWREDLALAAAAIVERALD